MPITSIPRTRKGQASSIDTFEQYLPAGLPSLHDHQKALPAIAKNEALLALIEEAVQQIPTAHDLHIGDCRTMGLEPESVQLVVTSPPY